MFSTWLQEDLNGQELERIFEVDKPIKVIQKQANGRVYEMFGVEAYNKPGVVKINQSLSIWLKFFIETGSYIDDSDDKWQILFLF